MFCRHYISTLLPISNIHLPFYSIYKLPIKVKAGKSQEHLCLHSDTNHAMVGIETLWKVKRTKKFPPFFAPSLSLSRSSSHIAGYCFFLAGLAIGVKRGPLLSAWLFWTGGVWILNGYCTSRSYCLTILFFQFFRWEKQTLNESMRHDSHHVGR